MKTTPLPSPGEAMEPIALLPSNPPSSQSTPTRVDRRGSLGPASSPEYSRWSVDARRSSQSYGLGRSAVNTLATLSENHAVSSEEAQNEDHARSLQIVSELRKQMEGIIAHQQILQGQRQSSRPTGHERPSQKDARPVFPDDVARKIRIPTAAPPSAFVDAGPLPSAADSTGSDATVTGNPAETMGQSDGQTPAFPFPRMQPLQGSNMPRERPPHNTHFKLRFPSEKLKDAKLSSRAPEECQLPARTPFSHNIFLPPEIKNVIEDPNYPSPNLYDLTLQLTADPGLDAWFSNLVDILQTYYFAERASIAIPGDTTDLENVPWGQKAVFNQNICARSNDSDGPMSRGQASAANGTSLEDIGNMGPNEKPADGVNMSRLEPTTPSKRPTLFSRHSFAGFGSKSDRDTSRLQNLTRPKGARVSTENSAGTDSKSTKEPSFESRGGRRLEKPSSDLVGSTQPDVRQAIFPIPRPLEIETDPLIKRTGVVKLFGRTKPVVLTREYSTDQVGTSRFHGSGAIQTPDEKVQVTPGAEPEVPGKRTIPPGATRTRSASNPSALIYQPQRGLSMPMEAYEEYEQIPPSPWSQSPAPSPAPRAHAEQNPFFTTLAVDEAAFSRNPPEHDYSKLEPLEAIGVDKAKSVVHIPLLHISASKESSPSTLRFPVAILSILSPVVPYPANLRQSLSHLMPHLATSFCLAQQYSQLERQVASRVESSRYSQLLGLGGTFSSENSELELVAGLSGHVSNTLSDDASPQVGFPSPGDRSSSTKFSPYLSQLNSPGTGLNNVVSGSSNNLALSPGVATKHGNDAVDSYFNVKRSRSLRDTAGSSRNRVSKMKQSIGSSPPPSPGNTSKNIGEEAVTQGPDSGATLPIQESTPATPVLSSARGSSRHTSVNSFYSQLHRELQQRPLPDTIAQLMLNSVPLHLFLAKPQSGEVIWTNAKFDAYRRSQPQEQRSRDPWQNIHSSEHESISAKWENALRTGSQFTERVRVKRFNDESSYRWFIFRTNPLLSGTGEVLYWIGSFLDVHEQHVAEMKAAKEREKFAIDAKYRAFSNSIPQVVFEAAEYRGLIFANDQWRLYSGQPIDEALNLGFAKHVHPDDLGKCSLFSLPSYGPASILPASDPMERQVPNGVTPALGELLKRGVFSVQRDENGRVFYSTEIRLRSKGGDYRWHLVRLVRAETISFGNGEASWYGTCTDINDRKLLEKELNKAMQQLNREMESKTKFFSNMSHEIRTPLNGILGTIPFILDTHLDTDQRRMLDTIQNSSTNLRELVDNILDVSRVEAGKMTLVNSWFHVRSVIEDVIDTIASRALDKGLEINYLMDPNVPPMVIGDRFRIRQVLINLMGNAVKFTSRGEIYATCSIRRDSSIHLKSTEMLLNFEVVDTGRGFSAGDSERLMQRFSQLEANGSQQHAGSGLGLFLSRQLVEMHGGMLTPSGKEGQGARFSFYVVVDVPPSPEPEQLELARQASRSSESGGYLSRSASYQQLQPSLIMSLDGSSRGPDVSSDFRRFQHGLSHQLGSSAPAIRSPFQTPPNLHATVQPLGLLHEKSADSSHPSTPQCHPASSADQLPGAHQGPFSILILAPLDHTREAIKQHIEQVVPHEVPFTIKSQADVEEWKDSVNSENDSSSNLTHLVVNLPVEDVLDVMQYVSWCESSKAPTLVVISDLYQKRQIRSKVTELSSDGKRIYTVPKPLKPSAFSPIFDPCNRRDLSKDRNQDMAREINDNFKTVTKMVKAVVGNKGYRVLLVEDEATNRMVGAHL